MRLIRVIGALSLLPVMISSSALELGDWASRLQADMQRLDASSSGELGVYVKRLRDGSEVSYRGERRWYLASTTKVLVAIALLQQVEAGKHSLSESLTLKASDYVDGSGDVNWSDPGTSFSLRDLLEKMLTRSDSTAADMLIRLMGTDKLNRQIKESISTNGFSSITTLLQVRTDAYGEVHPKARELTNLDFIKLKKTNSADARWEALLARLDAPGSELKSHSLTEAFERYYRHGLNSASLEAFGAVLEKLVQGELLSSIHTELILELMEKMTTGETRIKAGLPREARFSQKTGTQLGRICNVGVIRMRGRETDPVVLAACLEKFDDQEAAEKTLADVGRALSGSGVLSARPMQADLRREKSS